MRVARRLRWILALLLVGACVAGFVWLDPRLSAGALLLRFEEDESVPSWLRHYGERPVDQRPWRLVFGQHGRLYLPRGERKRGVLLVHGMHEHGIAEPRLVRFAHAIASTGVVVGTPEMPDLKRFRLTRADLVGVADAAKQLARELGVPSVAVFGISFGGGFALRAACDPALSGGMHRVIALGAPYDLARVAHFALGEGALGPDGERGPAEPHPYARKAMEQLLFGGPVSSVGAGLLPLMKQTLALREKELRALSPASCKSVITAKVHLVHGRGDRIIPYTETLWLARELRVSQPVEVLVSPVIAHAEYAKPSLSERLDLVEFMAKAGDW